MSSVGTGKAFGRVVRGGAPLFLHGGLRAAGPGLRNPLQALKVDERLRPPDDLRRAQADEELGGILEGAHVDEPGADSLEDMRVRARAHRQVVFAREAKGLVVEALEEKPRV